MRETILKRLWIESFCSLKCFNRPSKTEDFIQVSLKGLIERYYGISSLYEMAEVINYNDSVHSVKVNAALLL